MLRTRGFLHITYKIYHHLDIIDGEQKSHCLNVFLAVMKYAWKKNGYKAGLRHSTLAKDTGLCRTTVKSCLQTLNKLNIVKAIRGRSGKTYVVNEVFLKAEKLYDSEIAVKTTPDSRFTATLEEALYINRKDNKNSKITNIILDCNGSKEESISKLKLLTTPELLKGIELKDNPWYCKLALNEKESDGKGKVFVDPQIIVNSLKKIAKEKNPRYKAKKDFYIRNGIKPWEKK